jgi:hypothetical protein
MGSFKWGVSRDELVPRLAQDVVFACGARSYPAKSVAIYNIILINIEHLSQFERQMESDSSNLTPSKGRFLPFKNEAVM